MPSANLRFSPKESRITKLFAKTQRCLAQIVTYRNVADDGVSVGGCITGSASTSMPSESEAVPQPSAFQRCLQIRNSTNGGEHVFERYVGRGPFCALADCTRICAKQIVTTFAWLRKDCGNPHYRRGFQEHSVSGCSDLHSSLCTLLLTRPYTRRTLALADEYGTRKTQFICLHNARVTARAFFLLPLTFGGSKSNLHMGAGGICQ